MTKILINQKTNFLFSDFWVKFFDFFLAFFVVCAKRFDKIMEVCSNLNNEMKRVKGIHDYFEAESLEGKANLDQFLTGKIPDDNKDSEGLKIEDKFGFDVKMTTTCARKRKIWKMNHVSFVATVDRMMNSLPLVKK